MPCIASPNGTEFGDLLLLFVDWRKKTFLTVFSQDQAHLPDERISLINLQKGKAVVERFIVKVANEVST